jgi:hypothetical protein
VLGFFFSSPSTWAQVWGGFLQMGNVPVQRGEDRNGNGRLDPGEDWDGDGRLDVVEPKSADGKFVDLDGDGKRDGDNIENIFLELWRGHGFPRVDFQLVAFIAAFASIAGNGGLSNTPVSNYARDQGWGMGDKVGAIPSIVGGRGISLTHVGCVFDVNDQTLPRWRRWYWYLARDQLLVWMPACLVGMALPSMLSIEFLPRGTEADNWNTAVMTAGGVQKHVTSPPPGVLVSEAGLSPYLAGPGWGRFFWGMTLFCGFLVLGTTLVSTIDGIIRRWVDVFWIAIPALHAVDPKNIRYVYFGTLIAYGCFGILTVWIYNPAELIKWATLGYNFAIGFSSWHTVAINHTLLPPKLRPGIVPTISLIAAGVYFWILGTVAVLDALSKAGLVTL